MLPAEHIVEVRIHSGWSQSKLRETTDDVEPTATAICCEVLVLTKQTSLSILHFTD
jgi:hypothetical protein